MCLLLLGCTVHVIHSCGPTEVVPQGICCSQIAFFNLCPRAALRATYAALRISACAPTPTTSTCAHNNCTLQLPHHHSTACNCSAQTLLATRFFLGGLPSDGDSSWFVDTQVKAATISFFLFHSFVGTDGDRDKGRTCANATFVFKPGGALAWAVSHCQGRVRQDRGRQLTASTEG